MIIHYHSRDQKKTLNLLILNVFKFNEFFYIELN